MLRIPPAAQDFHHAYVRNTVQGEEGPVYQSLWHASDENPGSNCYILSSTTDPVWLVVSGKSPSRVDAASLAGWARDVIVKGRIDRQLVELGRDRAATREARKR